MMNPDEPPIEKAAAKKERRPDAAGRARARAGYKGTTGRARAAQMGGAVHLRTFGGPDFHRLWADARLRVR
jgi:hypothetical protein